MAKINPVQSLVAWQPGGPIVPKNETYDNHGADTADISLDSNTGQVGANTLIDHLPDPSTSQMESHLSQKEEEYLTKTMIHTALSNLKDRDRYVIEKRFIPRTSLDTSGIRRQSRNKPGKGKTDRKCSH